MDRPIPENASAEDVVREVLEYLDHWDTRAEMKKALSENPEEKDKSLCEFLSDCIQDSSLEEKPKKLPKYPQWISTISS
jgi:hypothetical protein